MSKDIVTHLYLIEMVLVMDTLNENKNLSSLLCASFVKFLLIWSAAFLKISIYLPYHNIKRDILSEWTIEQNTF